MLEFGVEDEAAWRAGLPCGGRIEVLVDRLSGERDREFLDHVAKARANRKQLIVSGDITRGGRSIVEIGDDFDVDTRRRLDAGDGVIIERGEGRQFLQAIVPAVQVLIIGAGHIAQVLSDLGRRVGLAMTVIDPRTAFATADRFRDVKLVHEWPASAARYRPRCPHGRRHARTFAATRRRGADSGPAFAMLLRRRAGLAAIA